MKSILTIAALFLITGITAQTSTQASVTVLTPSTFKITNIQNCTTGFNIRKPDLTWFISPPVASGSSIVVEFPMCGKGQVWPLIACNINEEPIGIEVTMCSTLPVGVIFNARYSEGNLYGEFKADILSSDKVQAKITMDDGTVILKDIDLKNRKQDSYFFNFKF